MESLGAENFRSCGLRYCGFLDFTVLFVKSKSAVKQEALNFLIICSIPCGFPYSMQFKKLKEFGVQNVENDFGLTNRDEKKFCAAQKILHITLSTGNVIFVKLEFQIGCYHSGSERGSEKCRGENGTEEKLKVK